MSNTQFKKEIVIIVNGCRYPLNIKQLISTQTELQNAVEIAKGQTNFKYPNLDELDTVLTHIFKHFKQ